MSNLKQLAELTRLPMLTVYRALEGRDGVAADVRRQVETAATSLDYTLNITIRDVAALAGVSVGTVSHVLNGSTRTRPETRQRVVQAINDLNYRPNSMARGLKSNHTRLIGYGWHKTEDPGRPNALLDRFLYDMAQAAEAWGYHILTFAQPSQISLKRYDELIQTTRIDGLVLTDIGYHDERVRYLLESGVPFVGFGHTNEAWDFPSVEVDGRLGMKLAVEHLIARGHERIALLCWPEGTRIGDERVQGYADVLAAAGIRVPQPWIVRIRNSVDHAFLATQQLLAAHPRPTAIACANDVMALGVKRYLSQVGLEAGIDVAITGYDDTPIAELVELTSIRQPIDMVAAKVIEILIGEIEGKPVPRRNILLEPTLVVRASSRAQR
ncbi:MAG TPA: LacI family DNA-binding transcriptional regulator [Herpetosiphonaceae bacterium]|nr:LacI family DNA-binding transcriptional regulator [Herpetosiphonaceae bacterium]